MEQRTRLNRMGLASLVAGVLGLVAAVAGLLLAPPEQFYPAYLFAFLYWLGISLGCLGWLMVHTLVHRGWGLALHRLLAAGARTIPLMAVLSLPLIFGFRYLYPWLGERAAGGESSFLARELYLNPAFFFGRALFYLLVWVALAWILPALSYRSDEAPEHQAGDEEAAAIWARALRVSVVGLILFVVTVTFAAFDWQMSFEPGSEGAAWFSSLFGWLSLARDAMAGIALALLLLAMLGRGRPLHMLVLPPLVNVLGAIFLATILLWGYLFLMQYLVIWFANIPAEVIWYERRITGGWLPVAWAFLAPIIFSRLVLLFRPFKRRVRLLGALAALVLVARLFHLYWLVMPAYDARPAFHWLHAALPLAIGGLWFGLFFWQLARHPLLPRRHPYLVRAIRETQEAHGTTA